MAFAEVEIRLSLPIAGSDATERTHLLKVWKQTGKKPKVLQDQPKMPDGMGYVWEWFLEIMNAGDMTWQSLMAWSSVTGTKLTHTESELLLQLNRLYATKQHGRNSKTNSKG